MGKTRKRNLARTANPCLSFESLGMPSVCGDISVHSTLYSASVFPRWSTSATASRGVNPCPKHTPLGLVEVQSDVPWCSNDRWWLRIPAFSLATSLERAQRKVS